MADDSPLLNLDEVPMNNILHFCDYLDISRLRNVCRSLRDHIDLIKPDGHMTEVLLRKISGYYQMVFKLGNNSIRINYEEADYGCRVEAYFNKDYSTEKLIIRLSPKDALMRDCHRYLSHQKSQIRKFTLQEGCYEELLNVMRSRIPESRVIPLKTSTLQLDHLSAAQTLTILPFFDSNCVKELKILSFNPVVEEENIYSIRELVETQHWRNAEKIWLQKFRITDVRQIFHLKKFEGSILTTNAADIEFLKNAFKNLADFEECDIDLKLLVDLSSIERLFGVKSFKSRIWLGGTQHEWFFRIPHENTKTLLVRIFNGGGNIKIRRIERSTVHQSAVIFDWKQQ